ncbi:7TM diverse intracellular signaling domain-containing protein [Lysobacter korlensis]|uniref:7TM diverse intracellular signaling domain-containing protein n=1 Tax=Lysobacter korlensis TaxID=553636 RepID=A0ABV6RKI9_9GAMM
MDRPKLALWLLLALLFTGPAGACRLQAELLYTAEAVDSPPVAVPVLHRSEATTRGEALRVRLPRRSTGHWLRLTCHGRIDAGAGWVFVVEGAEHLGELTFHPPGAAPRRVGPATRDAAPGQATALRRGWSLALPHGWPTASVAYLHVTGSSTEPMRVRLVEAAQLAREQRAGARLTVGAAAVLLAIALVTLAIYLRFRDLLYLSYAGYLVCIATYVVLLAGDAATTGVLEPFVVHGATGRWAVATLAVSLQLVFTRRILELDSIAPRASQLLRWLFWLHVALLATLLIGRTQVHGWYCTAGNVLLIISGPTVLGIAMLVWRRRATYAGYYLLGWTPLVASAALVAADQLGLVMAPWAETALPLIAVAESTVLAFALGRHAANRDRAIRHAQRSPDLDAVTGAHTAPALDRLLESWRQLGGLGARRYCLLMLDLDDLALIDDRHGPAVADVLLRQGFTRLRARLGPDDVVARIGRYRFAVVRACERNAAEALARQLTEAIAGAPFRVGRQSFVITASAGIATAVTGEPVAGLMQRAAQAAQRASALGGNTVSTVDHGQNLPVFAAV